MADKFTIPTTDDFNLDVDINLERKRLHRLFERSASGEASLDDSTKILRAMIGRKPNVIDGEGGNSYQPSTDTFRISPPPSLAFYLGVSENNMPPNISESVTPELMHHLKLVHEAEHATQFIFKRDEQTGEIDQTSARFEISNRSPYAYGLEEEIIKEADADLAVQKYLEDIGEPEVAQFILDARMSRSFVEQYLASSDDSYEHDTSSILQHFKETGDVIDVETFIYEKSALMDKINKEVGFGLYDLSSMVSEYDVTREQLRAMQMEHQTELAIRPQGVMHAVQSLLERGELEGLQKWEAENYMAAMTRLGYEPQENYDYESQLRNVLENGMGLQKKPEEPTPMKGLTPEEMAIEGPWDKPETRP